MRDDAAVARILVVDDHDIVRLGVRHLLAGQHDLVVAGEAAGAREALAWLERESADVLLLDLNLGDDFSLSWLPRLKQARPQLKVVVLTSLAEELHAERALRAGADAFVNKSALSQTLLSAVRSVLAGQVFLSEAQKSLLLRRLTGQAPAAPSRPELSPKEVEVLRLIADGKSTREIAETLNRSVKTIETHKQALKDKLGAQTPAMLVRVAVSWFEA